MITQITTQTTTQMSTKMTTQVDIQTKTQMTAQMATHMTRGQWYDKTSNKDEHVCQIGFHLSCNLFIQYIEVVILAIKWVVIGIVIDVFN
jgi:hypothetical protein